MQWQSVQIDALAHGANADDAFAGRLWQGSGASALTDPAVSAPVGLVHSVRSVAAWLDARGADLPRRATWDGLGLLTERAHMLGLGRSGRTSCGGKTRLVRASDGWIAVALARPDDVDLVPAWLDRPLDADPWLTIERAAGNESAADLRDRATMLGLACSVVGERAADREPVLASWLGDSSSLPVAGATVVNLAALWAGPLAAHLLHRVGATVIDLESSTRLDGARATPAFHRLLHDGHWPITIPFGTDAGRAQLHDVISTADVVIEGSRPRALEQLGIDAAAIVARGPQVWLSITAHGRMGVHGQRIGYGDDCAAAGGLVGDVHGEPRFIADAVADPLTGLLAAATVIQLLSSGGRWLTDIALSRVAASMR